MAAERDPVRLIDAIRQLVSVRGWSERVALGRLKAAWASVMGEQVAAHCEPVRLEAGVLLIRAEAGAWASELTMLKRQMVRQAEGFLGEGKVRDVRVIAGS